MSTTAPRETQQFGQPLPADYGPIPPPPRRRGGVSPLRVLRYLVLIVLGILFVSPFLYMVTSAFQLIEKMFQYPPQ